MHSLMFAVFKLGPFLHLTLPLSEAHTHFCTLGSAHVRSGARCPSAGMEDLLPAPPAHSHHAASGRATSAMLV